MSGKSGIILMLAGLSGLGAMFGAQRLMARREAPPEMRDVIVAARDLKVEEVLREDMIKVVQMPKAQAPAGSFSTAEALLGRWVQIKLLDGEPIIEPKLAPKDADPGLLGRIPPGMRALAVEVNEQTGVSGFILPDYRVDIIQAKDQFDDDGRKAQTLLHDVRVLAAGQATARPEDKSIQVRTVTLAVTPEQAETLVAARAQGPISLALRGLGEPEPDPEAEPEPEVVAEAPPPPPDPEPEPIPTPPPAPVAVEAPPPPRYTLIYRGFNPPERMRRAGELVPRADWPSAFAARQVH